MRNRIREFLDDAVDNPTDEKYFIIGVCAIAACIGTVLAVWIVAMYGHIITGRP